jgi:hypothetical protein
MAAYGKGQMLGSGINPESFKQDYSGFSRAAEIQAQGLQNLGQSIGGAIQNFGEAKKEQRKVDAYNKASAKSIEAAITLGKSYEIKGVEETLSPFLQSYNDPNLSPIEKAALLDEGKAMIPNVFGRFDQGQLMNARNTTGDKNVNFQQGEIIETINGKQYKVPVSFDPATGIRTRPDGTIVGTPATASGITSALNLPTSQGAGGLQNKSNAIVNALELPTDNLYTNDTNLLPPLNTGVESEVPTLLPFEGSQPNASVPSYAIPVESDEIEQRGLTKEEVASRGLPAGEYIGRFKNKQLTSIQPIPSKPDDIGAARKQAMDAPNIALIEKSQDSAQKLPSVQKAFDLLDSNAVKTGTFENYKVAAKRFFGQDVANEEQFMSLVGNLAMEAIDLTKGAISDREMTYFTQVLAPNIGKSVEGNKKILQFKIDAAKRDIEIGKKVTELFEKNATPSEVQAEVSKIMESNPLVKEKATTPTATPYTGLDDATKQALKDLNIDE